jgi:cell division protein FtsL
MGKTFNIIAACLIVILAVGLYKAKSEADRMRAEVAKLEAEVATARSEVKTMAAEAAYLESPKRVESLARSELGLTPAKPGQVRPISEIDKALPPAKPPKGAP